VTEDNGADPERRRGFPDPGLAVRHSREGQVLSRHRSPSGARPDAPQALAPAGSHRLPSPPAASLRGRITLAAVAAGAAVAGGQTLVGALAGADVGPVAALLPVAEAEPLPEGTDAGLAGTDAIGADVARGPLRVGPLAGDLGSPALDPRAAVDVRNLTKATDIGEQLAKRTRVLRSALAGGAPEASVVDGQAFVRPALGRLTSLFGARWGVTHYGIDIANAIGTPIYALTDGVVAESGPASGFGMWVVVRHADGESTVYGHVNRSYVTVGQQVRAGEHIADIGNRGFSTGPHLHLEVWAPDGTKLNPLPWLARHGLRL
jgi:murein DD-endopeptidase MepM/ murein hydrolase activator NlpD